MNSKAVNLSEQELATIISSLLFSSSVNVISNTNKEYQNEMFDLAKRLKNYMPDISLKNIEFLQEKNYGDSLSKKVLRAFKKNFNSVVNFEKLA